MEDPLIAFCGVDCAVCTDYQTKKCPGCRESEWPGGELCMPMACCGRKDILFCGQCAEFSCPDMQAFYEESEGHRQAYLRMRRIHEGRG